MGDTLLLEVMDGALRPLDRAIQEHGPETHAPTLTANEVEQIVRVCSLVTQAVGWLRQLTERVLPKGMERQQLARRVHKLLNAVERAMASFSAARDLVRREDKAGAGAEAAACLEGFLREAEVFRQELVSLLTWTESPTPPLPPELLHELEGPSSDRKYVGLDDFRAELQTGDG